MTAPVLKQCCLILDIERSGSKEEIVNRILTFLLNPEDSGKKVPSAKKSMWFYNLQYELGLQAMVIV